MKAILLIKEITKKIFLKLTRGGWSNERNLTFLKASSFLEKLTYKSKFSLLSEKGKTWLILNNGVKLRYTNKFNSISQIIVSEGDFEELELESVYSNLSENAVFFDIGANVGFYTLCVASKFKHINIHAFEPVTDTFLELKQNVFKNNCVDKIVLNQLALSDFNGSVFITTDHHSSNYLTDASSSQNKIKIDCATLDSYVERETIDKLDFIKIDVEGKELSVLRGAIKTIKRFKPTLLIEIIEKPCEFFDRKIEDFEELIALLNDLGYKYNVIEDQANQDREELDSFSQRIYHNYLFFPNI